MSTVIHNIIDFTKTHLLLLSSPSSAYTSLANTQLHNKGNTNDNSLSKNTTTNNTVTIHMNNSDRSVKQMLNNIINSISNTNDFEHNGKVNTLHLDVNKKKNASVSVSQTVKIHY